MSRPDDAGEKRAQVPDRRQALRLGLALGLGLPLAVVLVGVGVAHGVRRSHDAQVREVVAGLAADGLGVDDADLHPQPIRDGGPALLRAMQRLHPLSDGESLGVCELGSRWVYPKAFTAYYEDEFAVPDAAALERDAEAGLTKLRGIGRDADEALRAGAARLPADWGRGYDVELEWLDDVKVLAHVYELRALRAQVAGRSAEAWRELERLLGVVDLVREPSLIVLLVRVAALQDGLEALRTLLQLGPPPDDAQRARLLARLERLEWPEGLSLAFRGELFAALASLPPDQAGLEEFVARQGGDRRQVNLFTTLALTRDRATLVRLMAREIRALRLPHAELLAEADALRTELATLRPGYPITTVLLPAPEKVYLRVLDAQTKLRLAAFALRLAARPALPTRAPADAPSDPYGPSALRYIRRDARRATLYGVGRDGDDDRGDSREGRPGESRLKKDDEDDGDVVLELELFTR